MARVAVADVRAIMEVPAEVDDASLQAFIDDASMVVTEELGSKGLSDTRLAAIEKWLAAHFAIQLTERGGLTDSKVADSQDSYVNLSPRGQGHILGFQLTRYGQQAITLDTTNSLLKMSTPQLNARFSLIGKTATCQPK